jgi:MFS family permease
MMPQTIAYIQLLFTGTKERAKAIGLYGITLGIASITGQVLGGYLSDTHWVIEGWRLIFFINLPIGIITLWATQRYLEETEPNQGSRFDYQGVLILTAVLFSLIYPLIKGREAGWPLWSFGLLALAVLLFIYFVADQNRKLRLNKNPLIDVRLFRIKDFNIGLLAVLFHFMVHTSFLLVSAVYLQNGLGISSLACGLYYVFPGVLFTLASVTASRLIVRFGKRILQVGVIILITAFTLQALFFKPQVPGSVIFFLMGIYGLGNGLVLPSLLNLALKSVPQHYAGAAAGVYSTFQQTASALGVSIIGGIFFYFAKAGWHIAFGYAIAAMVVCLGMVGLMLYLLPDNRQTGTEVHAD